MPNVHAPPAVGKSPPEFLQFHIADQVWTVTISPTPLRENGRAAMTLRLPSTRQILISPDVAVEKRLRVLVAQLRQCWDMSGVDFNDSQIDNGGIDVEIISMALAQDLSIQGGENALRWMKPPGTAKATATATAPRRKVLEGLPTGAEKAWTRWQALGREMAGNADLELTIETFAPVCATFAQLRNAGYPFDQTLTALMDILKRQGFTHDGESDFDADFGSGYAGLPKSVRDQRERLTTNAAKQDLKFSLDSQGGVA